MRFVQSGLRLLLSRHPLGHAAPAGRPDNARERQRVARHRRRRRRCRRCMRALWTM